MEDFGIPSKNQHCKSFQIPTKSDRKCGKFRKSNHNQQVKSFQIKTIFRKFAWKNQIFEPKLTAIHLKSFTFHPEHTIFSETIVRDGHFSNKFQFLIHFWQYFLLLSHSHPFLSLAQVGNIYYGFVKNFKHTDF